MVTLSACGESDISELEKRVVDLERAKVIYSNPEKVVVSSEVNWQSWFSSIVTIFAVSVSLWLANRDRQIRLVVEAKRDCDDINVSITNIGRRDAVVKDIRLRLRCSKIKIPYNAVDEEPQKLEDGDMQKYTENAFLLNWNEHQKSLTKFQRILVKVGVITIVATVIVSTGKRFSTIVS